MLAGRVELDTHIVHARDNGIVQRPAEGALLDIMLILADTDGLGIDLHQLGERIHESASDRNRAAHREIQIREFLAGHFRGRIN